jgi:DNA repair exonuclease SbcCD ATPase subunit
MKRVGTLMVAAAAFAFVACQETPPPGDQPAAGAGGAEPTVEQQEAERERQRARAREEKNAAAQELRERLGTLERRVSNLRSDAEPVLDDLGESLRASLRSLADDLSQARSRIQSLEESGIEGWESKRDAVEGSLGEAEARIDRVAERLSGQKDVLARREKGREPVTGEFTALDGGNYDAYRVSVVRDVQRALQERGYYPGPADGVLGKPTMEALARFQEEQGLAPSGVPSPMTRAKLLGD